jgi:FkbM family methyltransferase
MKITEYGFAIIERDTHLGKWCLEHKRLDFDQNALPQMLPHIKPDGVVLDIGANIGCYAYAFGQVAKEVHCFEPNSEAYECLKYNLVHGSGTFFLHRVAVSDKESKFNIVSDNDNIGMAFVEESKTGSVKSIAIDTLELVGCDFIKIDVEGFELHVLRGAESTINKHNPVMVIEINDHTLKRTGVDRKEIFGWLTEHNYIYRNIYSEQGLNDDQLDIICFPNGSKTNTNTSS